MPEARQEQMHTTENVQKYAAKTDLETLIRSLAARGNLNHLSLCCDGVKGESFVAIFRDGHGMAPYRYQRGTDPVEVLKLALASIDYVFADRSEKVRGKKSVPAPLSRAESDDLI